MTNITREEVEAELTRRFKEGGLERTATMQDANKLACKIATDMACEEKYAPFFKHLYQPNTYSVSCSTENNSLTDIEKGRLNVDITLSGPLAEQYRRLGVPESFIDSEKSFSSVETALNIIHPNKELESENRMKPDEYHAFDDNI